MTPTGPARVWDVGRLAFGQLALGDTIELELQPAAGSPTG